MGVSLCQMVDTPPLGLVGTDRWRKGENLDGNYIKEDQNLSEISITGEVLGGLKIEKPKVYRMKLFP